jgi:ketosteroid isomerase-like protein
MPFETADARSAVIALYQAYGSRDPAQIRACLTEDAVWIAPPGNATQVALGLGDAGDAGAPDGSNNLGRDAIADFMAHRFGQLFTGVTNEVRHILADGDHAVIEHRLSATLPNGRPYVNDYCFVFRVENGRVAEIREYMDTRGGWAQAFGDGPAGTLV